MRRATAALGALMALATAGLTGPLAPVSAAAPVTIDVAYMPNMGGGASTLIAGIKEGFYAREGLSIHPVRFQSGPPEIAAMASGRIDFANLGPGAIFLPMKGQGEVILLDAIGKSDGIVVQKSSGIRTIAQLKGHKVLVPEGTTAEMILYTALKSVGLHLSDVTMINVSPATEVAAFLSGRAKVMAGWQPNTTEVLQKDKGSYLLTSDGNYYPKVVLPGVWVGQNAFVAAHPGIVARFVKASLEAIDYRDAHMQQDVTWVSQFAGVPRALLATTLHSYIWPTATQIRRDYVNGKMSGWLENLNSLYVKMGLLTQPYFDPTPVLGH